MSLLKLVTRFMLVTGDMTDGFVFYGPFVTQEEAIKWAENLDLGSWYTVQMVGPL